jgi:hypothetical protein
VLARDLWPWDLLDSAGQGPPGPRDLLASAGQGPPGPRDLLVSAGQGSPGPWDLLASAGQGPPTRLFITVVLPVLLVNLIFTGSDMVGKINKAL